MAYVPGFRHDVFITYSSDNYDARMAEFVGDLRAYLSQELGRLFSEDSVFFDRQNLNRTPTEWKQHLQQSAGRAAFLIPFLSQSYADSDYCFKELEWFCEDTGSPLHWSAGTEKAYRICPIVWRNLDGATFQQLAPEIRKAQMQQSSNVHDLGAILVNGLRLMRRSCQTVYVGENDDEVRGRLREELGRMGFRVMPEASAAYRDEELVRKHLGEARMAVHFLGGQIHERTMRAIQYSRQLCQGATVIYEIPGNELSPAEDLSLAWIEEDIRSTASTDLRDYDRVKGKNFDQFLQIVHNRLEGVRPLRPTVLGIACEEADRLAVEKVISQIEMSTGLNTVCHGLSLLDFKKSRGLLFYWGAAQGMRLRQARVAARGMREAFFIAPPPKVELFEKDLSGVSILRQQGDQFEVEDIRPLLNELGWTGK